MDLKLILLLLKANKKKIKKSKPLLNEIIKTAAFKNIMAEQYANKKKKEKETYSTGPTWAANENLIHSLLYLT